MRLSSTVAAVLGLALAACGDDPADVATSTTVTSTAGGTATTTAAETTPSTGAPSTITTAATTVRCGTVGFTPNSEDAAGDIRATGASCDDARAFVRVAGRQTSSGGPQEVDVTGYHCVRTRTEQDPLPQAFYECTKGTTTITFGRS